MRTITQLMGICLAGLLVGCPDAAAPESTVPEGTSEASPVSGESGDDEVAEVADGPGVGTETDGQTPPVAVADFEVHEWGFIHFGEGLTRIATSNSFVPPAIAPTPTSDGRPAMRNGESSMAQGVSDTSELAEAPKPVAMDHVITGTQTPPPLLQ